MMELTKWPRLLVVGAPLTDRKQAHEVIVRTTDWAHPCTNDRAWEYEVAVMLAEYGMPVEPARTGDVDNNVKGIVAYYDAVRAWNDKRGVLDLHYLHNSRVMSAWPGGPHGWCDWDGTIGCHNYNIGKWPTVEEVTNDWQAIANAFPFLTLTCQLVTDEGEGEVAATWEVHNGAAGLVEHAGMIADPFARNEEAMVARFLHGDRERGVKPDRLREAMRDVWGEPR